jgi:hypothetical protein
MSTPNLLSAAKRYGSSAILIGRIIEDANGLNSQWKLVMNQEQWDWTLPGKMPTDILPALIDHLTTTLATRFAVVTPNTTQKNVTVRVVGISQQGDFGKLVRYLNHLTPVADVGILRISGSEIMLHVSLRSTQQAFAQAIASGQQLTPLDTTHPAMVYQWNA